jgi:hypothetical protein
MSVDPCRLAGRDLFIVIRDRQFTGGFFRTTRRGILRDKKAH